MNTNNRRKKIIIILTAFILAVVAVHLVVFIFLNVKGKDILKDYVRKQFTAEAELDSVSFRFPFTVVVKNFKCDDLAFSKADVSLGLFNPFNRSISLSKVYIDKLNFKIKIEKDKVSVTPFFVKPITQTEVQPAPAEETKTTPPSEKTKQKTISIKIGKLLISNASAQVSDLTKDIPVIFNLNNVDIILKHFAYPKLPKFYLEVKASLDKGDIKSDNIIAVKGWADYAHRNMDVKFNINNADYIMFSDYYPPFWKPDNLGLKEAKLSLDSKINSLNNDLVIEAILALDKIEFLEETQSDSRANSLKTMIAFFKDENGKPVLPIKLRTKMDSFHIDLASLQSEFTGKMKLDIGTIVINILDKAKGKIAETTKEVKGATLDKAVDKTKEMTGFVVDKTKETAGTVKDITLDKTKSTIEGVVGVISNVINTKKENIEASQPTESTSQMQPAVQPAEATAAQPGAVGQQIQQEVNQQQVQEKPAENAAVQSQEPPQANTQEQSINTDTQTNRLSETPAQNTQANTENQNQIEPAQ